MTATAMRSRIGIPPTFLHYRFDMAYDEMFATPGVAREHYQALQHTLLGLAPEELRNSQQAADLTFLHEGITFTVYGSKEGTERIFPNDLLPRIIPAREWARSKRVSPSASPRSIFSCATSITKAASSPTTSSRAN